MRTNIAPDLEQICRDFAVPFSGMVFVSLLILEDNTIGERVQVDPRIKWFNPGVQFVARYSMPQEFFGGLWVWTMQASLSSFLDLDVDFRGEFKNSILEMKEVLQTQFTN